MESPLEKECKDHIDLKGPFSPLEMKVYGVISSSVNKKVTVDPGSVNAVLLDAEPQDPHTR